MAWSFSALLILEILILLHVAFNDIATRIISNEICVTLALLGVAAQFRGPTHFTESLVAAGILFALLFVAFQRGWMGGGDVKLLTALSLGLPAMAVIHLLTATALAGGALATAHLMLRNLPAPRLAPAGSSAWRRVYAVERWRNVRHAPLPYGAAIACGGIWTLINRGL